MQRFLIDDSESGSPEVQGSEFGVLGSRGPAVRGSRVQGLPRIRLMQKDMYAELARRRRRAQIAARRWVEESS